MKGKYRLMLLLILAALILSGCAMRTVEDMYRLPKRSEDYRDLQSVIDNAMVGMEYCAPLTGENQQTVQMADLDGDGIDEYLLFAKCSQEKPLRILIFSKDGDSFTHFDTIESNGSAFDQVEYAQMDNRKGMEIVVGCQLSDKVLRTVSIYTMVDRKHTQAVTANYTKFLTADMDGDSLAELFLLHPGIADSDNGIAELYTMKSGNVERLNEVNMSQPADKLKRMVLGKLDGGKTAVYVASTVGDTALITDVYTLANNKLANVTLSNESGTSIKTMRNFYIFADDIDNDGIVELPGLISMRPVSGVMPADMHHLIRWYAMTPNGDEVNKLYTYHNFAGGWYMQLSEKLANRLVAISIGNQTEIYLWDKKYEKADKLLTIYGFSGQNREEQALADGRFILHKTDAIVYAAALEEIATEYGLTNENVVYSFRMIQHDWKTGET